jgi:hypothetical protein
MPVELPTVEQLDVAALTARCEALLASTSGWKTAASHDDIRVSAGMIDAYPWKLYRIDMTTSATPAEYASFIADDGFEHLGDWNREFVRGETLDTLWDKEGDTAWLLRVYYATPAILANREYVYVLRRQERAPGHFLITYHSVSTELPVEPGYVRATLVDTVHDCRPDASTGRTTIRHILSGDLGGNIPLWVQNNVFAGGIISANLRDGQAQRRLLG